MTRAGIRIGIGTRVMYDGEVHVVTEWLPTVEGTDVVLRGPTSVCRVSLVELVSGRRARLLTDIAGPEPDDDIDPAAVVLGCLSAQGLKEVSERAAHLREVLTGFRSGSSEAAGPGEPRPQFDPSRPLLDRYVAKAAELGVAPRTIRRWATAYRLHGEAGLASARFPHASQVDPRWCEAALAIMREHTEESKPSEKAVISTKPPSAWRSVSGTALSQNRPGRRRIGSSNGLRPSTAPSRAPPRVTGISQRDPNGRTGNCSRPDRGST